MYTASIHNNKAGMISLNGNEDRFEVISITGLNPPQAQINTIDAAGLDGVLFNSSRLITRNIVIMLRITGDVEANRLALYRYFGSGEKVRFSYQNGGRNVYIDGYVETVECGLFSQNEVMQVSIICMDPYFQDVEESEASLSGLNFTAENDADADTGFVFEAVITTEDDETVSGLKLIRHPDGAYINLEGTFYDGDVVEIDTRVGSEGVWITRDSLRLNGLPYITAGSTFFQLPGAASTTVSLIITSEGDTLTWTGELKFRKQYRGV